MKTRKARSLYPPTHYYEHEYEKTSLYCELCGKRQVWQETGPGDYYLGPDKICLSCGNDSEHDKAIAKQLRENKVTETDLRDGRVLEMEGPFGDILRGYYRDQLERMKKDSVLASGLGWDGKPGEITFKRIKFDLDKS